MRTIYLFLLVVISGSVFSQHNIRQTETRQAETRQAATRQAETTVNIIGFGPVKYTEIASGTYEIDFEEYGIFTATGSISPLNARVETTIDNLRSFPGYKLYENLDLKEIAIEISPKGLKLEALLDTERNFGELMAMLKIQNPTVGIAVEISKTAFKLSGEIDFEAAPIVIDVIPGFSRFTLEKLALESEAAAGEGELELSMGFKIQTRWKPTEWDGDIQSVSEYSYNLTTNELSAAISMTDTWSNPMLLDKLLKPNSVVFTDVGASLNWPIGAPAPSGYGFTVGEAKFFNLDFGVFLDVTPGDKKVALMATRSLMTMNDLSIMMREGFGLNVPDIYPKDVQIRDVTILFSPNGGQVGEFEVEKGFLLKGKARMIEEMEAEVHFFANFDEGVYLQYIMGSDFKKYFEKVFRNHQSLKYVSAELLRTFNIRKMVFEASASKNINMTGRTVVDFDILGKNVKFDMEGSFSPEALAQKMSEEALKIAAPHADVVLEAVGSSVRDAGRRASAAVGISSNLVAKYTKLGSIKARHTHLRQGGERHCRRVCVPGRANHLVDRVLPNSLKSVQMFHDRVIADLMKIQGTSAAETRRLREQQFGAEWKKLTDKIENDWKEIRSDKEYVGYFVRPSDAEAGGRQFRSVIDDRKKEYDRLRDRLYNRMRNRT